MLCRRTWVSAQLNPSLNMIREASFIIHILQCWKYGYHLVYHWIIDTFSFFTHAAFSLAFLEKEASDFSRYQLVVLLVDILLVVRWMCRSSSTNYSYPSSSSSSSSTQSWTLVHFMKVQTRPYSWLLSTCTLLYSIHIAETVLNTVTYIHSFKT